VNETRDLESIIEAQRDLIAEQRRGLALREARIAELEASLEEQAKAAGRYAEHQNERIHELEAERDALKATLAEHLMYDNLDDDRTPTYAALAIRVAELEAALWEMADAIPQSYDWYQRRARNILNQGG